jgi:hypothetical protein
MATLTVTSVSFLDGDGDAANGEAGAPNGDELLSDVKGEGEASGDGSVAGSDPADGDGVTSAGAEDVADDEASGLGLPVSSAAAGEGVSSDPARHVASTSNVGEARCMHQR